MCRFTTTCYSYECFKSTKVALCPRVSSMHDCLASVHYNVEQLPQRCTKCCTFKAIHQQNAAIQQQIARILARNRSKYQEFMKIYQGMLSAMRRQRSEEVDRLAESLSHLELEHQTSVDDLTNRLEEFSTDERKRLNERTASQVCNNLLQDMQAGHKTIYGFDNRTVR